MKFYFTSKNLILTLFTRFYNYILYYIYKIINQDNIILNIVILCILYTLISTNNILDCQPTDGTTYNYVYDNEPAPYVNYASRPIFIPGTRELLPELPTSMHNTPELPATPLQSNTPELPETPVQSSRAELAATPIQYNSSIITENQSVASNIHELDVNISLRSSLIVEHNSVVSDINELGVNNTQLSSLIEDRSVITNTNYDQTLNVGYLAPDSVMQPVTFDYTERIKVGRFDRVITSFKSLNSKIEKLDEKLDHTTIKYYGMGKRKIYWTIWEKENGRFGSYRDFKINFDPNTNIVKQVYKDIKNSVKEEVKDIFYINEKRAINNNVSRDVQDLLRTRRPFNR